MGWKRPLTDQYLELAQEATDKHVRATGLQAVSLIDQRMPVDKGTARGNTHISVGRASYSYDPDARGTGDTSALSDLQPWPVVFINNATPYMEVIEFGSENRAPQLVFTTAFQLISKS